MWAVAAGLALSATAQAAPKNIILMISDGCGANCFDAADLYASGKTGQRGYEQANWHKLMMSTFSANGDGYDAKNTSKNVSLVKNKPTDSASSGTALATGKKNYDGTINVDVDLTTRLKTIVELADEQGKATGVVSSVEWSHATPASMAAHNMSRNNYAAIAQEMVGQSALDVIMGAGNPDFDDNGAPAASNAKYVGGATLWDSLKAGTALHRDGGHWSLFQDSAQVDSLRTASSIALPLMVTPKVYQTLQYNRSGASDADLPYADARNAGLPTLPKMTSTALKALRQDADGFFLMVEGGAIDWAGHGNHLGRLIEEQDDFNASVDSVVAWVGRNGGWDSTLVIVTADHETGFLTGPDSAAVGKVTGLDTLWKVQPLVGDAGTLPAHRWNSGDHTNQLVPLFARGNGAEKLAVLADEEDPLAGPFLKNSEVGQLMHQLWAPTAPPAAPKYVFLMITDGCGYNCFSAADLYAGASAPYAAWQQAAMSHYMVGDGYPATSISQDVTKVNLKPTDSAASGTALATGIKTYDGAIGVGPRGERLKTITDRFGEIGRATGVVTSVQWSHATPAAMAAHNASRNNYAAIANEMLFESGLDVIMGAGDFRYNDNGVPCTTCDSKYVGGTASWQKLLDQKANSLEGPWTLVQDSLDFAALALDATPPARVVGTAKVHQTLQEYRTGANDADLPYADPRNPGLPTLDLMTRGAINVLAQNPNGFFVMVEGGAIDWAGHNNHLGRLIEEQLEFDDAVSSVIDWIEDPANDADWTNTLVIVTADHETGFLSGPDTLATQIRTGIWGTSAVTGSAGALPAHLWNSTNHTNSLVPLFAKGAGADALMAQADDYDPVRGRFLDNAEVGQVLHGLVANEPYEADPQAVASMGSGLLELIGRSTSAMGSEISAFHPASKKGFVVGGSNLIEVLDLADPRLPVIVDTLTVSGDLQSVSVHGDLLAAAVAGATAQDSGEIVLFDLTNLSQLASYGVGALPDMVTFSPDGQYVVSACEGEPSADYTIDPEGKVAVIDLAAGATHGVVTLVGFGGLDSAALVAAGLRIGRGTLASDIEPEYVTISANSRRAYVTLQENNAIATINLVTGEIVDVQPLGYKDHGQLGKGLDFLNDGKIDIRQQPGLRGLYMPDAIGMLATGGASYLVTANEGDGRDYTAYKDEVKIKSIGMPLDSNFSWQFYEAAKENKVSKVGDCDLDDDGKCDVLYLYGSRSFTLWNTDGSLAWDAGDRLEQITAKIIPDQFNDDAGAMDGRSDNKGPEPEGLALGEALGMNLLFLGMERTGGVMAWDLTTPMTPRFVDYVNPQQDEAPEGLLFIKAENSPIDTALLVVTNEASKTTAIYKIRGAAAPPVIEPEDPVFAQPQLVRMQNASLQQTAGLRFLYTIEQAGNVQLSLVDLQGKLLARASGHYPAGSWTVDFSGAGIAAGRYLLRLRAGSEEISLPFSLQ